MMLMWSFLFWQKKRFVKIILRPSATWASLPSCGLGENNTPIHKHEAEEVLMQQFFGLFFQNQCWRRGTLFKIYI